MTSQLAFSLCRSNQIQALLPTLDQNDAADNCTRVCSGMKNEASSDCL